VNWTAAALLTWHPVAAADTCRPRVPWATTCHDGLERACAAPCGVDRGAILAAKERAAQDGNVAALFVAAGPNLGAGEVDLRLKQTHAKRCGQREQLRNPSPSLLNPKKTRAQRSLARENRASKSLLELSRPARPRCAVLTCGGRTLSISRGSIGSGSATRHQSPSL
jgi:hypothetical protein